MRSVRYCSGFAIARSQVADSCGPILIGADERLRAELAASTSSTRHAYDEAAGSGNVVVPNHQFPSWITGGRASLRCIWSCPGATRARSRSAVVTSANPAGRLPARTELAVRRYFTDAVDHVLHGQLSGSASPSRIRDAVSGARFR
jgi:L-threonylcarbamoyladenylate synthase